MKKNLMTELMQQMLPHLDNAQLKQLKQVMEQTLFHYEVTCAETKTKTVIFFTKSDFKKNEGCV